MNQIANRAKNIPMTHPTILFLLYSWLKIASVSTLLVIQHSYEKNGLMIYSLVNCHITMKNHHFSWVNRLCLWSFSIVFVCLAEGTYSPWFYHRNHCRVQEEAQPQIGHVAGIIRQFGDLRSIIKRSRDIAS